VGEANEASTLWSWMAQGGSIHRSGVQGEEGPLGQTSCDAPAQSEAGEQRNAPGYLEPCCRAPRYVGQSRNARLKRLRERGARQRRAGGRVGARDKVAAGSKVAWARAAGRGEQ
jgi:hypothetical protein